MHWYLDNGDPLHTVTGKNGKERSTTLRDARKLGLAPSVTEILKVVNAPALTNYFLKQQLEAAYDTPLFAEHVYSEWARAVKDKAREHSLKARDKGVSIHHQLERYYSGKSVTMEANYVEAAAEALQETYGIKVGEIAPEQTFARDGYGGAVDLSNEDFIIDYKFKGDGFDDETKLIYDNHFGQLAAYKHGLKFPKAICANVFIGGGGDDIQVRIIEHTQSESEWGLKYFMSCLFLWETIKRYKA